MIEHQETVENNKKPRIEAVKAVLRIMGERIAMINDYLSEGTRTIANCDLFEERMYTYENDNNTKSHLQQDLTNELQFYKLLQYMILQNHTSDFLVESLYEKINFTKIAMENKLTKLKNNLDGSNAHPKALISVNKKDPGFAYYYLHKMFKVLQEQRTPHFEEYETEILKLDPKVFSTSMNHDNEFHRMSELCHTLINNLAREFKSDYLHYFLPEEILQIEENLTRMLKKANQDLKYYKENQQSIKNETVEDIFLGRSLTDQQSMFLRYRAYKMILLWINETKKYFEAQKELSLSLDKKIKAELAKQKEQQTKALAKAHVTTHATTNAKPIDNALPKGATEPSQVLDQKRNNELVAQFKQDQQSKLLAWKAQCLEYQKSSDDIKNQRELAAEDSVTRNRARNSENLYLIPECDITDIKEKEELSAFEIPQLICIFDAIRSKSHFSVLEKIFAKESLKFEEVEPLIKRLSTHLIDPSKFMAFHIINWNASHYTLQIPNTRKSWNIDNKEGYKLTPSEMLPVHGHDHSKEERGRRPLDPNVVEKMMKGFMIAGITLERITKAFKQAGLTQRVVTEAETEGSDKKKKKKKK